MLLNFFKDSAAVIGSLDRLESVCVKIAEDIKKVIVKEIVFYLLVMEGVVQIVCTLQESCHVLIREMIENLSEQFVCKLISLL